MATHANVLRAVRRQFEKSSGFRLAGSTNVKFHSIYGRTLRRFLDKGKKSRVDPWGSKVFRRWVLLETSRIGREARRRAGGNDLTPDHLRAAALKVMRAAKAKYRVWMPSDGFPFQVRSADFEDCDLCAEFTAR